MGKVAIELLRKLVSAPVYNQHIITNQQRILQLLKTGNLDEGLALNTSGVKMDELDMEAQRLYLEIIADIASRT